MKRRAVPLLLMAIVAGVLLLLGRGPTDEDLVVYFGRTAPHVREVDLHFQRPDGASVRDVILRFPTGAPDEVHHPVRIKRGSYEVAIRVLSDDGREAHVTRSYETGAHQPIDLER